MTRRAALLVPVFAAVFVVAGCDPLASKTSTAPTKTLSHAEFVRRANRACARASRQTKKAKKVTTIEQLNAEYNKILLPAIDGLIAHL